MTTITKERVTGISNGEKCYTHDDVVELARIALASLEAEAVGEVVLGEHDDCGCHPDARVVCIAADGQADWENFKDGTRLYAAPPSLAAIDERAAFNTWNNDENLPIAGVGAKNAAWLSWQARAKLSAPPAPVSVPDEVSWEDVPEEITEDDMEVALAWAHGFNQCRAAMLQGAENIESPPGIKPAPVVPEELLSAMEEVLRISDRDHEAWHKARNGIVSCRAAMLQGSQPVSNRDELLPGIKPAPELDSVAKNAESLPGNSPVIGWLRSDYNSDDKRDPNAPLFMLGSNDPSETWGVKYLPLSGNSPVIPDGYVVVPKEITCAMDDAAWEAYHETRCMSDIWAALLAAAPQQEGKNG
ncbi:TPA: hypothetical protein O5I88_000655 [Salmonella enterica]|uniref:hypothetical protein n=1 Tax=Salmonella enterica TaxID=28901 RepID=UPI0024937675|nr:hypothetical protein [Salmonella enterica]BCQ90372.1 hypothetical protein SAML1593_13210 [Salmonella enterica]BCQ94998.1 hypothetical protein SAML1960_13180 [Salmonella enterica]BCQ99738.1 hypothetical protein SAML2008_14470 [Salmonella enterica]HDA4879565.1 hypothetical protein [Salmonella enterica]HDA5324046.1 hypothetical protein [Salmonella enterica]